jgi:integrase
MADYREDKDATACNMRKWKNKIHLIQGRINNKSWINVNLKRIFRKYGIEVEGNISSHMFRKKLGNRVLKLNNYSGESVILLMELFSHSSPAITKKYLGIRVKEILDVYDSVRL